MSKSSCSDCVTAGNSDGKNDDCWPSAPVTTRLLLRSDDGRAEGSTLDEEAPHQGGVRGQAECDPESGGPRDGTHQVERSRRAQCDWTESLQTQLVTNWPNYLECAYAVCHANECVNLDLKTGARGRRDHRGDGQPRETQRHQQGKRQKLN